MKRAFVFLSAVFSVSLFLPARGVGAEGGSSQPHRTVVGQVLVSDALPALRIEVSKPLGYLGAHDFRIGDVAAGTRYVFAEVKERTVRKLVIAQFEGFLPQSTEIYRYRFDTATPIAGLRFRENAFAFSNKEAALEQPNGEAAGTVHFLEQHGLSVPDEWLVWRSLTLGSETRKNELILFYMEPAADFHARVAELGEEVPEKLAGGIAARAKKAYAIEASAAGGTARAPESELPKSDALEMGTLPRHVYAVPGPGKSLMETWQFDLLVLGADRSAIRPGQMTIDLKAGPETVKTENLSPGFLASVAEVRYRPLEKTPSWSMRRKLNIPEVVSYRLRFTEPASLKVTEAFVRLRLQDDAQRRELSLTVPISRYVQKTALIFPFRGNSMVTQGTVVDGGHSSRDTQFALDTLGLSVLYAPMLNENEINENLVGWGREILAPADGTVAFSRNDVPTNPKVGEGISADDLARLGATAIGGNSVVIDHGNSEFSVLMHMQPGSVRVRRGDTVVQGQVIGLLGNSGDSYAPHLHFCLQDGPELFNADALPFTFQNLGDVHRPTPGTYFEAK